MFISAGALQPRCLDRIVPGRLGHQAGANEMGRTHLDEDQSMQRDSRSPRCAKSASRPVLDARSVQRPAIATHPSAFRCAATTPLAPLEGEGANPTGGGIECGVE
eukprot:Polyplicarium_translucidae@DN2357_c0_g1_i2.p2